MSCFGMASSSSTGWPLSPSRSARRRGVKPWRLWRRCAGLAAEIHSKIRRRVVQWPVQGGAARRRRSSVSVSSSSSIRDGWCHHRSFSPVYVDELYSHPKTHHVALHEVSQQQSSISSAGKLVARPDAAKNAAAATFAGSSGKASAVAANNAAAAAAATNAGGNNVGAAVATKAGARGKARVGGSNKAAAAAAATNNGGGKARGGVRSLLMSPLRGGVGVCGMGEVDVRAELFIRKFREEMRLQSQQSAEEFHAMLARGL